MLTPLAASTIQESHRGSQKGSMSWWHLVKEPSGMFPTDRTDFLTTLSLKKLQHCEILALVGQFRTSNMLFFVRFFFLNFDKVTLHLLFFFLTPYLDFCLWSLYSGSDTNTV